MVSAVTAGYLTLSRVVMHPTFSLHSQHHHHRHSQPLSHHHRHQKKQTMNVIKAPNYSTRQPMNGQMNQTTLRSSQERFRTDLKLGGMVQSG